MKRKGFTVLELLIVAVIVCILAAVLFPIFARARDIGLKATCQSNLKQLGMAFQLYFEDYPIKLEAVESTDFKLERLLSQHLVSSMDKAVISPSFTCPSDNRRYSEGVTGIDGQLISYGWNILAIKKSLGREPQRPEELVLVCDANQPRLTSPASPFESEEATCLALRHRGGANFLFFDHHVKCVDGWSLREKKSPVVWEGVYLGGTQQSSHGFPGRVRGVEDGLYIFNVRQGYVEEVAGPINAKE